MSISNHLCDSVKPGIAKKKPSEVEEYLKPLLKYAEEAVPEDDRKRTPIFLFGTASLRALSEKDRESLLKSVRATLKKTSFNFTLEEEWARAISGEEEGVYGWITANYMKEILMEKNAKDKTVGFLDLGGLSLQITFVPKESPLADSYNLILPNNNFDIYTHSFQENGQDATIKSLITLSASKANATGVVPDDIPFPCYLNGYSEEFFLETDQKAHTVYGTGEYELCSEYVREFLDLNATCKIKPCSFAGIYQPKLRGDFYATSGFYYTSHFLGIDHEEEKTPARLFRELGSEFCQKSWENATKEHPDISSNLLRVYCLTSSYIYNLVTEGFGFDEEKTNIFFTSEIKGTALNWALGALLAETFGL